MQAVEKDGLKVEGILGNRDLDKIKIEKSVSRVIAYFKNKIK